MDKPVDGAAAGGDSAADERAELERDLEAGDLRVDFFVVFGGFANLTLGDLDCLVVLVALIDLLDFGAEVWRVGRGCFDGAVPSSGS